MTNSNNVSEFELGWMAGIIDGEGCIYMFFRKKSNYIYARFQLHVCDYEMVEEFSRLLTQLQIHHIWKVRNKKQKDTHSDSYILDVHTKKDILKFTRIFKEILIVKSKQCKLMNEYLERAILSKRYQPNLRDKEIVQIVKNLKKHDQGNAGNLSLKLYFKYGNQQPILRGNSFDGSETNRRSLTDNAEGSNPDTSALHPIWMKI